MESASTPCDGVVHIDVLPLHANRLCGCWGWWYVDDLHVDLQNDVNVPYCIVVGFDVVCATFTCNHILYIYNVCS